jgi:hypothetical protein
MPASSPCPDKGVMRHGSQSAVGVVHDAAVREAKGPRQQRELCWSEAMSTGAALLLPAPQTQHASSGIQVGNSTSLGPGPSSQVTHPCLTRARQRFSSAWSALARKLAAQSHLLVPQQRPQRMDLVGALAGGGCGLVQKILRMRRA